MTTNKKIMGGAPRGDGRPRRPMLTGPDGKKVRDNPANRRRLKLPQHPDDIKAEAAKVTAGTDLTGDEAARKSIAGGAGAVKPSMPPVSTAPTAGLSPPDQAPIDWAMMLNMINVVISQTAPEFAMTDMEREAIAIPLGQVIEKYFPGLSQGGPELILGLAVAAYLIRVITGVKKIREEKRRAIKPEAQAPTNEFDSDPVQDIRPSI